jgi:hypothetical protein
MSGGLERSDKNEDKNGSVDVTQRCQSIVSCVVRRLIFGPGVPGTQPDMIAMARVLVRMVFIVDSFIVESLLHCS